MMGGQHGRRAQLTRRLGQRLVAHLTRRRLHAQAAPFDPHAPHGQLDAQRRALALAMFHPRIGVGVQPMVHVHGVRPAKARGTRISQRAGKAQQGAGVAPAAVGDYQRHIEPGAAARCAGRRSTLGECIVDRRLDRGQQRALQRVSCRPTFP